MSINFLGFGPFTPGKQNKNKVLKVLRRKPDTALTYDKVTVLESEKRAWENSPDAQAIREALNPWRHTDAEGTKKS
ncbi:hypothetical protein E2542_SST24353 [Spatholobus suberectus]|nr:hypothetical protein E2542_SST24353 [Spatholobus suberectus]